MSEYHTEVTIATPNKRAIPKYATLRDSILKMYIERKKIEEMAKALNISKNTAWKYQQQLVKELGDLTSERTKELKEEFVAKSFTELDIVTRVALGKLSDGDSRTQLSAVNTVATLIKTKADILTRLRVIDSGINQNITVNNTGMPTVERLRELYERSIEDDKKTTNS